MPQSNSFVNAADDRSDEGRSLAAEFGHGLDQQDHLCRELEDLADSLPGQLNTHQAVLLMERLRLLLRRTHLLEETLIFPVLIAAHPSLRPVLSRMCAEHAEDEDHASDLEEAVSALRARSDAERVGYMIRCLFVGLRRHVAFERDHIQPLLREAEQG